jgi:hypothetical protein
MFDLWTQADSTTSDLTSLNTAPGSVTPSWIGSYWNSSRRYDAYAVGSAMNVILGLKEAMTALQHSRSKRMGAAGGLCEAVWAGVNARTEPYQRRSRR